MALCDTVEGPVVELDRRDADRGERSGPGGRRPSHRATHRGPRGDPGPVRGVPREQPGPRAGGVLPSVAPRGARRGRRPARPTLLPAIVRRGGRGCGPVRGPPPSPVPPVLARPDAGHRDRAVGVGRVRGTDRRGGPRPSVGPGAAGTPRLAGGPPRADPRRTTPRRAGELGRAPRRPRSRRARRSRRPPRRGRPPRDGRPRPRLPTFGLRGPRPGPVARGGAGGPARKGPPAFDEPERTRPVPRRPGGRSPPLGPGGGASDGQRTGAHAPRPAPLPGVRPLERLDALLLRGPYGADRQDRAAAAARRGALGRRRPTARHPPQSRGEGCQGAHLPRQGPRDAREGAAAGAARHLGLPGRDGALRPDRPSPHALPAPRDRALPREGVRARLHDRLVGRPARLPRPAGRAAAPGPRRLAVVRRVPLGAVEVRGRRAGRAVQPRTVLQGGALGRPDRGARHRARAAHLRWRHGPDHRLHRGRGVLRPPGVRRRQAAQLRRRRGFGDPRPRRPAELLPRLPTRRRAGP